MILIRDNVERIVEDQKIAEKMIAEEGYKEVPEKKESKNKASNKPKESK